LIWEHPRLPDLLVRGFAQESEVAIPRRSLADFNLAQSNKSAYNRDFNARADATGEQGYPQPAVQTFENGKRIYGAFRNFTGPATLATVSQAPDGLLRTRSVKFPASITNTWKGWLPEARWSVQYRSFNPAPQNLGLISETTTAQIGPHSEPWLDWNTWIFDDFWQVCQEGPTACLNFDTRHHVRTRYRAYIKPDPLDPQWVNTESGAQLGEIYSAASAAQGVLGHQLVVQADIETTKGDWRWLGLDEQDLGDFSGEYIARYGMEVTNLTTGQSQFVDFDVPSGRDTTEMEYTFTEAGLYKFHIYLKAVEGAAITVSTPLKSLLESKGSGTNWLRMSHPIRFMVYVSPTPDKPEPPVVSETETSSEAATVSESSQSSAYLLTDRGTLEGTSPAVLPPEVWWLGGLGLAAVVLKRRRRS